VNAAPPALLIALDALADTVDPGRVAREAERLQQRYRTPGTDLSRTVPLTADQAAAYAIYRMPATYAAVRAALAELQASDPTFAPTSLLDVGGGPGAAAWAAGEAFDTITSATVVERDPAMATVGRSLAALSPYAALRDGEWIAADLTGPDALPGADLATASYSLGELAPSALHAVVDRLLAAAPTVVVVEPGTPAGFATVHEVRAQLIEAGRTIAAPCPHDERCPMADTPGDWCHVAARLTRSSAHRRAKGATLGYEDEKFSYVAATSRPAGRTAARVLRHPQIRSGHVRLRLCTRDNGLQDVTVSKRQGAAYKAARDVDWGDRFDALPDPPP
jgi:ribosomal protein RSM22 (predicted rRNA methylase)